jgi:hypothetical protein
MACLPFSLLLAQTPEKTKDSKQEVSFVFGGMRAERGKMRTGQCRVKGRWIERNRSDRQQIDDGIDIFIAFDGERRRFDIRQPDWIPDEDALPNKALKRAVTQTKFYDSGKKAAFWRDYSDQIEILPSYGDRSLPSGLIGFFDVRALGLYSEHALQQQATLKAVLDEFQRNITGNTKLRADLSVRRQEADIWTVRFGYDLTNMEAEFLLSVNVRNGFTPTRYLARVRNKVANAAWLVQEDHKTSWAMRSDVWVPVKYEYISGADMQQSREVSYAIEWEKINEPIDEDLFDYHSFGAPDSVGVVDGSLGTPVIVKAPAAPPPPTTWWKPAMAIIAAALFLAAIGRGLWHYKEARFAERSGDQGAQS